MIRITPQAAERIRAAAAEGGMEGLSLRIAAKENPDGSIEYGMGFDEAGELDIRVDCNGIDVIIAPISEPLLMGAVLDFVELEPNQYSFIFLNPNDPNFEPPNEGENCRPQGGCNCGNGGCGGS
ncbi:MAG: iron-sulfur cluster biosynthesis family protein [Gammaproteobacteria bacterium]